MFITKKRHAQIMAQADDTIQHLVDSRNDYALKASSLAARNAELTFELATLRAAKARSIANLSAANARRSAEAQAKAG